MDMRAEDEKPKLGVRIIDGNIIPTVTYKKDGILYSIWKKITGVSK